MRTIKEWFESVVDAELMEKLLANLDNNEKDSVVKSLNSAINLGFFWSRSNEGHDYWNNIHKEAFNGKIPTNTPLTQQAETLLATDRQDDYGDSNKMLKKISQLWSAVLEHDVTPQQVAIMMTLLKLARESYKHKDDNILDAVGYLTILDKLYK